MRKLYNFFLKQYTDIINKGLNELLKKIKIFLKYLLYLPIYFLAIIITIIIKLLSPIFIIRIEKITAYNFGDLLSFVGLYYCKKKLLIDQPKRPYIDILYLDKEQKVSNYYLLNMWKKKIKIFPSFLLKQIDQINKLLPSSHINSIEIFSSKFEYDVDNLFEKYQPLSFSHEEIENGKKKLREFGLQNEEKFICLAVRDNKFSKFKESANNHNIDRHEFRNSNIDNFISAAEILTDRGYFVFRMGTLADKKLITKNKMIIDYANSDIRNEFMDIFLGANCSFFLSTGYGVDMIPYIFNRPMGVMSVPIGDLRLHSKRFIFTTKKHFSKIKNKNLSISEIFELKLAYAFNSKLFKEKKVELIDYTEEEVKNFALEAYEKFEKIKHLSNEELTLQDKFKKIFSKNLNIADYKKQVIKPYYKLQGEIVSDFSSSFLKKNKDWVN